jgi:hypothetical protein
VHKKLITFITKILRIILILYVSIYFPGFYTSYSQSHPSSLPNFSASISFTRILHSVPLSFHFSLTISLIGLLGQFGSHRASCVITRHVYSTNLIGRNPTAYRLSASEIGCSVKLLVSCNS